MVRRRGTMRSSSLDLRRSLRQTQQYHHLGDARHHHSHEHHHHSHEAPHRHLTSCEVVAAVGCGPRHQRRKFQLAGTHNEEAQSWTTQQFRNWLRTDASQKANGEELMMPSVPSPISARLSSPLIGSAFSCTPLKIRACKRRTCQGQRCRQATLAGSAALGRKNGKQLQLWKPQRLWPQLQWPPLLNSRQFRQPKLGRKPEKKQSGHPSQHGMAANRRWQVIKARVQERLQQLAPRKRMRSTADHL